MSFCNKQNILKNKHPFICKIQTDSHTLVLIIQVLKWLINNNSQIEPAESGLTQFRQNKSLFLLLDPLGNILQRVGASSINDHLSTTSQCSMVTYAWNTSWVPSKIAQSWPIVNFSALIELALDQPFKTIQPHRLCRVTQLYTKLYCVEMLAHITLRVGIVYLSFQNHMLTNGHTVGGLKWHEQFQRHKRLHLIYYTNYNKYKNVRITCPVINSILYRYWIIFQHQR